MRPFRRFAAALALLCGAPFVGPALAQSSIWETFGPPLFQVNAVAAPDELTVYAGSGDNEASQSAIFRSIDGGRTWSALAEAARGEFYNEILVDDASPQRIYAGALGNGGVTNIYLSSDGGATWTLSDSVSPYCLPSFAAGAAAGTVFLSCGTRVHRSDDAGQTWRDLPTPFTEPVRLTPGPAGSVLAYGPTRIFKSVSGGSSWNPAGGAPPGCPGLHVLRADPKDSKRLVAGTGLTGAGGFQCGGVFRSADSGATWTASELSGAYVTDIAIDADEPLLVYASAGYLAGILPRGGVYSSRDGGSMWRDLHLPALGAVRLALSPSGRLLHAATSIGVFEHRVRKTRAVAPRR